MIAGGDIELSAGINVNNYNVIQGGGDLTVTSDAGYILNRETGVIDVDGSVIANGGTYFQNRAGGLVQAGNDIIATSQNLNVANYGLLSAQRDVNLTSSAANFLNYDSGVISAGRNVVLDAANYVSNRAGGVILAGGNLSATSGAGYISNDVDATIDVGGIVDFNSGSQIYDYGTLNAASIDFDAAGLVRTRREGRYNFEGTVNAGSYEAEVGRWLGYGDITTVGSLSITSSADSDICLLYTSPSPRD